MFKAVLVQHSGVERGGRRAPGATHKGAKWSAKAELLDIILYVFEMGGGYCAPGGS